MNRREFLVRVGGTLVAVPMVLEAVSCGSDSSPAAPAPTDRFSVTSTSTNGHTHRITLLCTDLTQNGITYTSTTDSGHSHQVTIDATKLQSIAVGGTETVQNTPDGTHMHSWTIQKPTNVC